MRAKCLKCGRLFHLSAAHGWACYHCGSIDFVEDGRYWHSKRPITIGDVVGFQTLDDVKRVFGLK